MKKQSKKQRNLMFALCLALSFATGCAPYPENQEAGRLATKKQKIIGGVVDLRYPAVGALVVESKETFCTGTLVTPYHVLTAAHCVDEDRKIAFRFDIPSSDGSSYTPVYVPIRSVHPHPQYNKEDMRNDVAVIVLGKKVTGIQPIQVMANPMDRQWEGVSLLLMGYGYIQRSPATVEAKHKYSGQIPLQTVYTDRFSTYAPNRSMCHGDSGGPALYIHNNVPYVVGISSYVEATGHKDGTTYCDGTGFSMRVDVQVAWFRKVLEANMPSEPTTNTNATRSLGQSCSESALCKAGLVCVQTGNTNTCMAACNPSDPNACSAAGGACNIETTQAGLTLCGCSTSNACTTGHACQTATQGVQACMPGTPKQEQQNDNKSSSENSKDKSDSQDSQDGTDDPPVGLGCQSQRGFPASSAAVLLLLGLGAFGRKRTPSTGND